jgi:divalent metal cation (Fe/Co/Zn/Cd) transporter
MTSLATLIVSCCDLIEAEGRSMRLSALRLGVALMLLALAGSMGLAGLGIAVWALYAWLATALNPPAAAAITALFILIITGALMWCARRMAA